MATKTQIANKTMINLGEAIFTDVDADGTTPADEFNALWDSTLEDALTTGPELGYGFSQWSTSKVDVDSITITGLHLDAEQAAALAYLVNQPERLTVEIKIAEV